MSVFSSIFYSVTQPIFRSIFTPKSGSQDGGPVTDYVLRYKLDSSDRVSNINGVQFVGGVVPKDCKGGEFDGALQYLLDTAQRYKIGKLLTGPFTLTAWVRNSTLTGQSILSLGNGDGLNDIDFRVRGDGTFGFRVNTTTKGSTTSIANGLLNFITLTSTGTGGTAEWFINAVSDKTASMAAYNITTPEAIGIGAQPDGSTKYAGFMDDIRIYNRVLSPAEITALYGYQCGTTWNDSEAWVDTDSYID